MKCRLLPRYFVVSEPLVWYQIICNSFLSESTKQLFLIIVAMFSISWITARQGHNYSSPSRPEKALPTLLGAGAAVAGGWAILFIGTLAGFLDSAVREKLLRFMFRLPRSFHVSGTTTPGCEAAMPGCEDIMPGCEDIMPGCDIIMPGCMLALGGREEGPEGCRDIGENMAVDGAGGRTRPPRRSMFD